MMISYTQVLTEREEGGTPNIIGAIRLGLVLHLHVLILISIIIFTMKLVGTGFNNEKLICINKQLKD